MGMLNQGTYASFIITLFFKKAEMFFQKRLLYSLKNELKISWKFRANVFNRMKIKHL